MTMDHNKLQWSAGKIRLRLEKGQYPLPSIAAVILLLLAAPFVSLYLAYVAFAVCLYRVIVYDTRVFAMDMALLSSFSMIFLSPTGSHLISYVLLIGSVWQLLRRKLRVELSFVLLILLLDYGVLRVHGQYASLVFWFTGLLTVRLVALELQPKDYSHVLVSFCTGLLVASVYALIFRNTSQFQAVRGAETVAYMGSSLHRFTGTLGDPNFFAAYLILGMAFSFQLWSFGHMRLSVCLLFQVAFGAMGVLTYSKTFIVCAVLLILAYIYSLLSKGKLLAGLLLVGTGLAVGTSSLLSTVGYRLASAESISDLTTGRSELFVRYLERIVETLSGFLFGQGMDAPVLERATHNVYLDVFYYIGAVGFMLMAVYLVHLTMVAGKKAIGAPKSKLMKYLSLAMLALLFCTLQGMLSNAFYVLVAVGISSVGLENKGKGETLCQS